MTEFLSGWKRQWDVVASTPDYWMTLITNPLLAVVFLAIVRNAGRDDLLGHAVLAPALLGMWAMSLFISGEVVARDRDFGLLEASLATPSSYGMVSAGRIALVTVLALFGFVESWLTALLLFGVAIPIRHPLAFAAGLGFSAFAMAGTALLMSALFIRSTSVRRFQNTLSYPFYVLGGILVPVALLPDWVQPFSRIVFLSWSSDLLRDSLNVPPVDDLGLRLLAIATLGAVAFLVGRWLVHRMEDHIRQTGEVSFT